MSPRTRRIASIVAVGLALFLVWRTSCEGERQREPVRFALDFGERAAEVRHVRVDLWVGDDSIGYFDRSFGAEGATAPVRFEQPVPRREIEATVSVTYAGGEVAAARRQLQAEPGDEITLRASN